MADWDYTCRTWKPRPEQADRVERTTVDRPRPGGGQPAIFPTPDARNNLRACDLGHMVIAGAMARCVQPINQGAAVLCAGAGCMHRLLLVFAIALCTEHASAQPQTQCTNAPAARPAANRTRRSPLKRRFGKPSRLVVRRASTLSGMPWTPRLVLYGSAKKPTRFWTARHFRSTQSRSNW